MATTPPKQRKIPERKCLGCGKGRPKKELVRIVRAPDGGVSLDFTGKKPGRGAYICKQSKCLERARKARRIGRSLACEIPDEVLAALEAELAAVEKDDSDEA